MKYENRYPSIFHPDTYQNLDYQQFDGKGNLFTLADTLNGITHSYVYDPLDRLQTANGIGTNPYNQSYQYDRIGNITNKSDVGSYSYFYNDKPHAVQSAGPFTFTYDNNGNMTQRIGGGDTITINPENWNYDNKPTQIQRGATTITLTYDGNGQRVRKQSSVSGTTLYFGELYEIRGGAGTIHLFAGNRRVASVFSDGRTQFYHTNHLGSASVITDQNGVKKEKIEYFPFGTYREAVDYDPNFPDVFYTYTGQEDDDDLGLYNYKARLYDPVLGKFISPDSIVPNPEDPQTLNRYSYVMNNPLIYIDPMGHFSFGAAPEFDLLYGSWDAFALNSLSFNLGASGTSSYLNSNCGTFSLSINIPNINLSSVSNTGFSPNFSDININFNPSYSNTYNRGTLEIGSFGPQYFGNNPINWAAPLGLRWTESRAVLLDIAALSFDIMTPLASPCPPLAALFYFSGAATSTINTLFTIEDFRQGNADRLDVAVSIITTIVGFYPSPVTLYGSDIAILIYDIYRAETYKGQKSPAIDLKFRPN